MEANIEEVSDDDIVDINDNDVVVNNRVIIKEGQKVEPCHFDNTWQQFEYRV